MGLESERLNRNKVTMAPFRRYLLRDLALLSLTVVGWFGFAAYTAASGVWSDFFGVVLGLFAGACAWQFHEWGHLLAGWSMGAKMRAPKKLFSVYLFGFDNKQNSRAQFLVMALGGFVATGLVFAFVVMVLPADWMATRITRSLVMLEIAVTAILEVPGFILGAMAYSKLPSVDVLSD